MRLFVCVSHLVCKCEKIFLRCRQATTTTNNNNKNQ